MKLQAIKRLCVAAKRCIIVSGPDGTQWISDGYNFYKVVGIRINDECIQELFGLKYKEMEKIAVTERRRQEPIFSEAAPAIGEKVTYYSGVWAYEQVIHAFAAGGKALYVQDIAMKPTSFDDFTDLQLVYDDDGRPLIAIYRGLFCDALVSPLSAGIAEQISSVLQTLGGRPVFGAEEVSEMEKIL